ncbi:MAG: UTP--glucose-1-phosphate uridylyltransferase GalU [Alphaproteobacteria bacterium]|nr:UTP--glucose-1-phosphate uridylyltransferase GalU [Alphaproteobacteria bacterium]MBV8408251.1 UTP--glucose-1-phosphate uridylyltransferase GalU [Alphaproteobacteria bacterium]
MALSVRKAVLPVAGLGTRFLPATKAMPKEMLTVVDRPLIQYAVEECLAAGVEEFVFVTGRNKGALEDHFDTAYELEATLHERGKNHELKLTQQATIKAGNAIFTRQQQPLGLGHAIWCARDWVGREPFAVLLPDELTIDSPSCTGQLVAAHERTGGNVVAVMEVPREQTKSYGIAAVKDEKDSLAEVTGLVEKPNPEESPSTLAIIGRYILQPEVFDHLDRHEKGAGGEIQLTDAMAKMVGHCPFHALRYRGLRYDCGSRIGFLEANVAVALHRADTTGETRALLERVLKA